MDSLLTGTKRALSRLIVTERSMEGISCDHVYSLQTSLHKREMTIIPKFLYVRDVYIPYVCTAALHDLYYGKLWNPVLTFSALRNFRMVDFVSTKETVSGQGLFLLLSCA